MKRVLYFSALLGVFLLIYKPQWKLKTASSDLPTSGAGIAMDAWTLERLYPSNRLPTHEFFTAFKERSQAATTRNKLPAWKALGPKNIAGRTLALAFHPSNPAIIYLGSASGGLWKTETMGLGATAWERVPTGFPLLGVGAIAINPDNPDQIFIGTGEVYNNTAAEPGIVNRLTRGSYGIGILKSEDGGQTWSKSLDWSYQTFTGIQQLVFHPNNSNIIYAATTEGLYQTLDSGDTWTNIHDVPMAVDIVIPPEEPTTIFVTHGSFFNDESGIFRSTDAGAQFELLTNGLPVGYTGKAMLALKPNASNEMYASVANAFGSIGLFRTRDSGDSWTLLTNEDVAKWQGWYSHDIAASPYRSDELVYVGIDSWHSNNSGRSFTLKGGWNGGPKGKVPIEGPDGPPDYVHSDIHRAYFHPLIDRLFLATDGGVFVSEDGGRTFGSRNGGLQTTQFYANFSNSTTDSLLAIGGMQDNWTAIYDGTEAWIRRVGGDGMTTAINPSNDRIMYTTTQYGRVYKSLDRGKNFEYLPTDWDFEIFNPPLEIASSAPKVLYTANEYIIRSSNGGNYWESQLNANRTEGNDILTITVSPHDEDHLLYGTVPSPDNQAKVFLSKDGGATSVVMLGLPNLMAKDFAFHPDDNQIMYAIFSGFGEAHFWKTLDGGETWVAPAVNLPDLPHHSILVDPLFPDHIYVGNDLGVYFSEDGGILWEPMMTDLPEAIYAINLSYSPANRKIRVATHGNGVYEAPMVFDEATFSVSTSDFLKENTFTLAPNPINNMVTIGLVLEKNVNITLALYDMKGKFLQLFYQKRHAGGKVSITRNLSSLPIGGYLLKLDLEDSTTNRKEVRTKKLIKIK